MGAVLDLATVQAFVLVAELNSFTRAAEALGTTQAAVSLKLQRLETLLAKRLVERSPRAVRLTAEGAAFLARARTLMQAHDAALAAAGAVRAQLTLGISDHAAGPELVRLLETLQTLSARLALSVTVGFSRALLDAYDRGELDAVVVRREGSRRGGETLAEDELGWFASPALIIDRGRPLPLVALAPPCGIRALAIRELDRRGLRWTDGFRGGGVAAVIAAAAAGLGVAPLARRLAPSGLRDVGAANALPRLGTSKVVLHSKVADPAKRAALRTLAASFRGLANAA